MKVFLSYKFTNEHIDELRKMINSISKTLRLLGHDVYNSLEDEQRFRKEGITNSEIMQHTFNQIDKSDLLIAFINSSDKSEGMLLEIGYAIAKGKKFVLAIKNGISTTSIEQMAASTIKFDYFDELLNKFRKTF